MQLREMINMKFLKKTAKPLLFIVLALVVLWIGFAAWIQHIDDEASREVAGMSPIPTQHECMDATARRISVCESSACYGRAVGFGANCLQANKEGRELFCKAAFSSSSSSSSSDRPSEFNWRESYCNKHKLSQDGCIAVLDLISSYCSDEFPQGDKKP